MPAAFASASKSPAAAGVVLMFLLTGCDANNQRFARSAVRDPSPSALTTPIAPAPPSIESDESRLLLGRLEELAGDLARDCGLVNALQSGDATADFAIKALGEGRSFVARFDILGIDTVQTLGFAGDSAGNVYQVWYYGFGWTTSGQAKPTKGRKIKFSDNGRFSTEQCPNPARLTRDKNLELSCSLPLFD